MIHFFKFSRSVSKLDEEYIFPYWDYANNQIQMFGYNETSNNMPYHKILLACYQFVIKNKDKLFK